MAGSDNAETPPPSPPPPLVGRSAWRRTLGHLLFDRATPAAKACDYFLMSAIVCGVVVVMLESMAEVRADHGEALRAAEWTITILFTVEYGLRLLGAPRARHYALSFFGIVDLLSFLPTYVGVLIPGAHYLLIVRILRLLRVFRVFKLTHYVGQGDRLIDALRASRAKIVVFMFAVVLLAMVLGTLMYVVEEPYNARFSSIPRSVYWAVVTLTTVGYGDIAPITALGQIISVAIMLLGYAILAVPTGIVIGEMGYGRPRIRAPGDRCPRCGARDHETDARYCRLCGEPMPADDAPPPAPQMTCPPDDEHG